MKISVILPTYNERENIEPLIRRILAAAEHETRIIVVDDDSPDKTWEVVETLAKTLPSVELLRRIGRSGLVSALSEGIASAQGDVVVWMDCDLSMPPEKIEDLLKLIEEGVDAAVGSRFVKGGGVEIVTGGGDTIMNYLMSVWLNRFIRFWLFSGFKDYTSGFIAIRREILESIPLRGDYGEYFIDLIYRALKKGHTIKEIPYLNIARRHGISKTGTNILSYFRRGSKYILTTLRLRFSKIN